MGDPTTPPKRTPRPWTGAEVKRAAALWADGMTQTAIAVTLGRSPYSLNSLIRDNRDRFPMHRELRDLGPGSAMIKLAAPASMNRALAAEAKRTGKPKNEIVRIALREHLARRSALTTDNARV